ncbi:hypothetical protein Ddye_029854 [Dipteronia dyeriana]|uniref:Uncharacterized protein n=1 Tax=Dipteronia dyeriana TaxID=168575 RepID=A0AAD9TFB9_9ROSI|nr:hypothetical protein Ddye_029854 [Dipteronia dyeriana]
MAAPVEEGLRPYQDQRLHHESVLLLSRHCFAGVDMRIRVKGGRTSQIYSIRRSRTSTVATTGPCSLLIPGAASP